MASNEPEPMEMGPLLGGASHSGDTGISEESTGNKNAHTGTRINIDNVGNNNSHAGHNNNGNGTENC